MALSKQITLGSGVTTSYHRIVSVSCITNIQNIIELASYTSQAKREEEARAIAEGAEMDVFIETRFVCAPYDQEMTVEGAYQWVKENVPDFEGAQDAL